MNLLRLIPVRLRPPVCGRGRARRRPISFETLERRELLAGGLDIGMNINEITSSASTNMFVDAMKMSSREWGVTSATTPASIWSVPGAVLPPLDGNGYPIGLGDLTAQGYALYTLVFTQNGQHYPTGTYTLTFDGKGTVAINGAGDSDLFFTQGGGAGQPFNVNIPQTYNRGLVVAITSSDPSDYVRNIRLVMPGFQDTYQAQPFNPQYLSGLEPFSTIRFMTAMQTNTNAGQSGDLSWSERTPPTYFTQVAVSGMSVEYMVQLCNTLHENMWVSMPVNADNDYELQFARYVRDNLNPGLKVYVEYGNEVWNGQFGYEYAYANSYAEANGLDQYQAIADLTTNCWNSWRQAFAGQTDRMVRVVASQFTFLVPLNQEIARLVATSSPTDPNHGFDIIAGASYFGDDFSSLNAQTTVQELVAAENANLTGKFATASEVHGLEGLVGEATEPADPRGHV